MTLSIITINYNDSTGLHNTMESVVSQSCQNFEYIVVDGASTDGSVDVIKEYAKRRHIHWVSEPDNGIYNAMNKGVRMAQGEYVLMLNSADTLVDNQVIGKVFPLLDGTDIIQGNIIEGEHRNRGYGRSNISFLDVQHGFFLHQAAFCQRSLFAKYGYFDESYRYVSDTIFFIKTLGYGGASFKYVGIDICNFDMNGFTHSKDENVRRLHAEEESRMQHELFPGRLYDYCIDSERKVALYDLLHSHTWIWKLSMLLKVMAEKLK